MTDLVKAAEFVAHWEGYKAHAYWDVNAWRLGFGSDTEGPDEERVTRGMSTTLSRSKANLAKRLHHFLALCIREVGFQEWHLLTEDQQIALIDICYNYGHIPFNVQRGDVNVMANRFLARGEDNREVNKERRRAEAHLWVGSFNWGVVGYEAG